MHKIDIKNALRDINHHGYHLVNDFWTLEKCHEVISEIEAYLEKPERKIWHDPLYSDQRIFGLNKISPSAQELYDDKDINRVFDLLTPKVKRVGFVLGAKLLPIEGNLGSGQGWHKDSAREEQFKAILYLSDVKADNGPFQYVDKSNRLWHKFKMRFLGGADKYQDRFNSEKEKAFIEKEKITTFTAKAGTLLISNTSGIHRGMPITSGVRYALTIYSWYHGSIPEHIQKVMI